MGCSEPGQKSFAAILIVALQTLMAHVKAFHGTSVRHITPLVNPWLSSKLDVFTPGIFGSRTLFVPLSRVPKEVLKKAVCKLSYFRCWKESEGGPPCEWNGWGDSKGILTLLRNAFQRNQQALDYEIWVGSLSTLRQTTGSNTASLVLLEEI